MDGSDVEGGPAKPAPNSEAKEDKSREAILKELQARILKARSEAPVYDSTPDGDIVQFKEQREAEKAKIEALPDDVLLPPDPPYQGAVFVSSLELYPDLLRMALAARIRQIESGALPELTRPAVDKAASNASEITELVDSRLSPGHEEFVRQTIESVSRQSERIKTINKFANIEYGIQLYRIDKEKGMLQMRALTKSSNITKAQHRASQEPSE